MSGLMGQTQLIEYAKLLRALIIQSTTNAGSGHPTSCLSAVEAMTVLFAGGYFRADPSDFLSVKSDQIIFSKGHAAPLLYCLFALSGHISKQQLLQLRKKDSPLEGHPLPRDLPFVAAATGSLGQGIGVGVGTALAQKKAGSFAKTWVLLGDSECAEGSVWESLNLASHYKLDNLILLIDVNRLGQRGETMFGADIEQYARRFAAFGAEVLLVENGNSITEVSAVFASLRDGGKRPKVILLKTKKGAGISFLSDQESWHGKTLSREESKKALEEIGEVREDLLGSVALSARAFTPQEKTKGWPSQPLNFSNSISTREAFGKALQWQAKENSNIITLDAETGNSTFSQLVEQSTPDQFVQTYIAEQSMISIAIGLGKVGGYFPVATTFSAFLTRAYDQIRMAAYSDVPMIIVGTHSGVSIGEDGVSQMGLEDIAMMRAVYGTTVLAPADGVSTQKLLELQLNNGGINYLRLARGKSPLLYDKNEKFRIGGSKTLRASELDKATIFASGVTVHEALAASDDLKTKGIYVRVVDMYSVQPVDIEAIKIACGFSRSLFVVEDHRRQGGLYSAIVETGAVNRPIFSLAANNFPHSATPEQALNTAGIDRLAIIQLIQQVLK